MSYPQDIQPQSIIINIFLFKIKKNLENIFNKTSASISKLILYTKLKNN